MSSEERVKARPTNEQQTILIVDDDRDIGDILQKIILDQTNYKVMWIAESDLALDAAPFFRPSLLLLDYMMPSINGLELYDRLQGMENTRGVPTILISASSTLPFEELRARGIYVLKKPFELDEFLDLLAQFLPTTA
ncbi:MAG: response regulator [Chloroflexota bacterium]|nr:response regulator [Chloroflexota bacterium]